MIGLVSLALTACGSVERDNPLDPKSSNFVDLETALIGRWSLETETENQVYEFKSDSSVELVDYASASGAAVDRNAGYPETIVSGFTGTYTLGGKFLRVTFTSSWTNEPGAPNPSLPPAGKVSEIGVVRDLLTLTDSTGERVFTKL